MLRAFCGGKTDLASDFVPDVGRRLDRLDHDVEFAEPALPKADDLGKSRIDRDQRLGLIALIG
jgi:hypothetical protein